MIDQFVEFMSNRLTTINFVQDNFDKNSRNNCTLIRQTGGSQEHYYDRQDYTVQFLTRNKSRYEAKKESKNIYDSIRNIFHVTIPSVTVDGDVYPEYVAAKIVPIQLPGAIGSDKEMRFMYSFNIVITTI